jgi:sugar/nucleoside kinase (ribokinase family)
MLDAPDQRNGIQVADRANARLVDGRQTSVYHLKLQIRGEIVVAGNLVEDILVRPVERIEYGFTVWVESIEQHLGGNGANTSYTLATLGIPVRLRGAVGRDGFGDRVLERLRGAGVNLEEIERMALPTASSVVLVAPDGSRSFLHAPGVSVEVFSEPGQFGPGPGHFHLANIFSLPQMRRTGPETLARAAAAGWTTSLDTGHDTRGEWMTVLDPCFEHIGFLFANEAEALKISGLADVRSAARLFLARGVRTVVIKRGRDGCAVFGDGGTELWAHGFAVETIDTTGAGDCFTGGFLAAIHLGSTLEEGARLANACGALSASRMGSVTGLLGYQETLAWAAVTSTSGT